MRPYTYQILDLGTYIRLLLKSSTPLLYTGYNSPEIVNCTIIMLCTSTSVTLVVSSKSMILERDLISKASFHASQRNVVEERNKIGY